MFSNTVKLTLTYEPRGDRGRRRPAPRARTDRPDGAYKIRRPSHPRAVHESVRRRCGSVDQRQSRARSDCPRFRGLTRPMILWFQMGENASLTHFLEAVDRHRGETDREQVPGEQTAEEARGETLR